MALLIGLLGAQVVVAQESQVFRALELEDASRWEEAAELYRSAIRGPMSVQALFGLERALLTLSRGEELAAILVAVVRERPDDDMARAMYVRTLLRLERADAARAFVRQWVSERPLDPEAYRQLYTIGPISPGDARSLWRRFRGTTDSAAEQEIVGELVEQVFAQGLWGIAAEILEERYTRAPTAELADQLSLAAARAGSVDRARAVAAAANMAEESAAYGWLALYDGDLVAARRLLGRADEADPAAVLPLAVLSRATGGRAPSFGAAYLRLVRGDTAEAARAFARAASEVAGAEPLVLAWAARLFASKGDLAAAERLYDAIARDYPASAEAPEATLSQARALLRSGQRAAAMEKLEHLILTYPQSALVPAARRELDSARGSVPPA